MTLPNPTPVIGITTYADEKANQFHLPRAYVSAIRAAGGLPILLTPGESKIDDVLDLVDGLVFAGGGDIAPEVYGGCSHSTIAGVNSDRDRFEMALAKQALQGPKPVLGICRGFQLLGVASGGSLIPHVPDRFGLRTAHRSEDGEFTDHSVQIIADSRLSRIVGRTEIVVRSKHHQAIDNIPDEWRVVAQAADGLIEGLEHQKHPWMTAVLWHPEESPADPAHLGLFRALVAEAAQRASTKAERRVTTNS